MKLAYDIRMSELEVDKGIGLYYIIPQDDEQLKIREDIK